MKLLINESQLQVLPSLALKVGLNEAILLQQLHFRSLISKDVRDGHKWVYKTYNEWKYQEFPFWSVDTIIRTIRRLENKGYIISTSVYNRLKMDKTKWYRIDYSKLHGLTSQNAPSTLAKSNLEDMQVAASTDGNLPLAITKELKSNKKEHVENDLEVVSVLDYLNEKISKQFKASSKATERLVKGRFREGYKLDDFKKVIDLKVKEWLNDLHWQKYLRPSTLFNATNFENYLEESRTRYSQENSSPEPVELNFSEGEE